MTEALFTSLAIIASALGGFWIGKFWERERWTNFGGLGTCYQDGKVVYLTVRRGGRVYKVTEED